VNTLDLSQAKPLSDYLPADKARQLVDLLREVRAAAALEVVEISDADRVLGCFVPLTEHVGMPPLGTPEFEEELRRRMESKEPVIPAEEVIAWLDRQIAAKSN
jgi:hypothetical protein